MKIKKGMILNKVGEKYVAVPTDSSNNIVRLNETAYDIWCGLDNGLSVDEISENIVKKYDGISIEDVKNDVRQSIDYLFKKGILEND